MTEERGKDYRHAGWMSVAKGVGAIVVAALLAVVAPNTFTGLLFLVSVIAGKIFMMNGCSSLALSKNLNYYPFVAFLWTWPWLIWFLCSPDKNIYEPATVLVKAQDNARLPDAIKGLPIVHSRGLAEYCIALNSYSRSVDDPRRHTDFGLKKLWYGYKTNMKPALFLGDTGQSFMSLPLLDQGHTDLEERERLLDSLTESTNKEAVPVA